MDCVEVSEIAGVGLHFLLLDFQCPFLFLHILPWVIRLFNFSSPCSTVVNGNCMCIETLRGLLFLKIDNLAEFEFPSPLFVAIRCSFTAYSVRMSRSLVFLCCFFLSTEAHLSCLLFSFDLGVQYGTVFPPYSMDGLLSAKALTWKCAIQSNPYTFLQSPSPSLDRRD